MTQSTKNLRVGLGEALRRLLDVEIRHRHGVGSPELVKERDMLLVALNRVEIELGFDCDSDGLPDSVDLFRETSETSCCRIIDLPGVRKIAPERLADISPSRIVERPKAGVPVGASQGPGFFGKIFGSPEKETK